jgi:SAM-dependent methyltransferase
MEDLHEHVSRNRAAWTQLNVLPDDLSELDAIELGCGTAYVSAWLARRGARPVGIDNSAEQLRSARAFQQEFGLEFPLWHGNAEDVPAAAESVDLVISEYGASIWCDPYRWIPEAARLLRPGGQLIFLVNGVIAVLTFPDDPDAPAGETLLRPYFGMHRFEWPGDNSVEFHLPHGEMISLLRRCGFEIERLVEVRPPEGSTTNFPLVTLEWARQWPCEEIWMARKQG